MRLSMSSYSLFSKPYFLTQGDFLKDPYKHQSLAIPGRLPESIDEMFVEKAVELIDPSLSPLTKKRVILLSEKIANSSFWKREVDNLTKAELIQLAYSIDTALLYGRQHFGLGYISSRHLAAPFRLFVHYNSSSVIAIPKKRVDSLVMGKDTQGRHALLIRQVKPSGEAVVSSWETRELFHQKSKMDRETSQTVLDRTCQQGENLPLPNWYATFIKNGNLHQLFDFHGGKLLSEIIQKETCDYSTMVNYAHEIAKSVKQLHDKGFVHNNLRPDNILITKKGPYPKVVFLGARSSFPVSQPVLLSKVLDPTFISPAVLEKLINRVESKAIPEDLFKRDTYALGGIFWMMHCKKELPWAISGKGELKEIIAKKNKFLSASIKAKSELYSKKGLEKDKMVVANIALALLDPRHEETVVKLDRVIEALEEPLPPIIRIRRSEAFLDC